MSTQNNKKVGVVLMTYGSATTAEHVAEYFERIYKGRASAALVADFEERYRLVGGSPLVDITKAQAKALGELLGERYVVRAGMRHSEPFIKDMVAECVHESAEVLVGVILSPQFSAPIMEAYKTAFMEAARAQSVDHAVVAGPWPTEEHFVELLARKTDEALVKLAGEGLSAPVVFTTHSLPQQVVEKDPGYLVQLRATIDAVRNKLDLGVEWHAAYQSAGHTPEEWLKPDLTDILAMLAKEDKRAVLIVPVQFLADHLEILYDLDIAARAQCEERGIAYRRIALPNTDPLFIESLRAVVEQAERGASPSL